MPSLHAAYPFMLMLFFWSAGKLARILLGAYTLAMAFALVYGGEHFVVDILVGWAMALAAYALVDRALQVLRAPGRRHVAPNPGLTR
jgi:membrane-associated phospholipid phosphatase